MSSHGRGFCGKGRMPPDPVLGLNPGSATYLASFWNNLNLCSYCRKGGNMDGKCPVGSQKVILSFYSLEVAHDEKNTGLQTKKLLYKALQIMPFLHPTVPTPSCSGAIYHHFNEKKKKGPPTIDYLLHTSIYFLYTLFYELLRTTRRWTEAGGGKAP